MMDLNFKHIFRNATDIVEYNPIVYTSVHVHCKVFLYNALQSKSTSLDDAFGWIMAVERHLEIGTVQ